MKIVWMHVRIFLCLTSLLILLGIVTVSPCAWGEKCSLFGRKYHWDGGRLEELTGAMLFLTDERASGFVTGVVLPVDGGFSAYSGV